MKKLVLLALAAAPAVALAAPATQSAPRSAEDPHRMICRTISDTGSRLARHRLCMTADEWAQQRRELRNNVDRAQTQGVERGGQ
jgi:hypothetical protein